MKNACRAVRDGCAHRSHLRCASLGALALLAAPALLQADLLHENFDGGIPPSWSVEDYHLAKFDTPSSISWGMTNPATYANYTGGSGGAAMADSDSLGDGGEYDIALLTPWISLPNEPGLSLSFISNYQNMANSDFADVDIRVGAHGIWTTLQSWNEDHGDSFRQPIGEAVTLPLDAYAGSDVQFRFHYYDPNVNDWNWYWQVDNVVVTPAPGAGALALMATGLLARRRRRN